MVCSWALVLIRQDSGCPSKRLVSRMQRKNSGKQQGPTGLYVGSFSPCCAVAHTLTRGAEQLPHPHVAAALGQTWGLQSQMVLTRAKLCPSATSMAWDCLHGLSTSLPLFIL